ncbi:MAG: hypothetical protein II980_07335 [Clostridia bacterium]|nr:hypothetical protein [Clostridia bacterium]
MTKKEARINIISSCICRDCFEIAKRELMSHTCKIELFYQAISPFSIYARADDELQKITENDLVYGTPWMKRLILADFRKNPFDSIEPRMDTFLLLDLSDFARSLYRLYSDDSAYIINTDMVSKNTELIKKHVKSTIYPWELPKEYIEKCIDSFVYDLTKRYAPSKTILCKVHHVSKYVSRDGRISSFTDTLINKYNEFIDSCTEYFIKAYEKIETGLHIIEMPKNVLAYELHKWGNSSRHYCNEYYEYLLSSIDVCMCEYERETERAMLDILLSRCERDFDRIYMLASQKERDEKITAIQNSNNAKILALIKERDAKATENKVLKKEIEGIRASKSYKIGRFFTYIPRKLRGKRNKK